MNTSTLTNDELDWKQMSSGHVPELLHLVIAWSREEPDRIGESAPISGRCVLGRGGPLADDPLPRVEFSRQRPDGKARRPPLSGPRISRVQLEMMPKEGNKLEVRSVGRCQLLLNGEPTMSGLVSVGDVITLQNVLVLLVVRRLVHLAPLRSFALAPTFAFGAPDPYGIVGESPSVWAKRDSLAFAAQSGTHILVHGESGAGKELAARAIHQLSTRREKTFIARNAATFPEGLVDAELFGTAKNYPNAGMPERPGLVGDADGGTLFLDEIGELPPHLQAHLLRVLDHGGEYQRLGETRTRRADIRLIGATNRPLKSLKHDVAARFPIRVTLTGLNERREDIPLLCAYLLAKIARTDEQLASRYFERRNGALAEPRIDPALMEALLRHMYTHHLRELEQLLWISLSTSPGNFLTLTPELGAELCVGKLDVAPEAMPHVPERSSSRDEDGDPDRAAVEAALTQAKGGITAAARLLGLKNRFAMYRLMKRRGIATTDDEENEL
ncbi:MAG TPA: sigma 54-interacting transcriptional regulator [Polyangium sp.]|nr:sigma 54-interacting transcriptional regulator [Polyangium sp.]